LDSTHAWCVTDLSLDASAGTFSGAELVAGATRYPIESNTDGAGSWVLVKHPLNAPPAPGAFAIAAGTAAVATIDTDINIPVGTPFNRQLAGVLVSGVNRMLVVAAGGARFVCAGVTTIPAAGDVVTWYPAYAIAFEDTGFGPAASARGPVAHAQVAVAAVRRMGSQPVESPPSHPGTLTAVDASPPREPVLDSISSGTYCAELASRADWYGISRFELKWTPAPAQACIVYRALGDAIRQLDIETHGTGSQTKPHSFPQDVWPADMWADVNRRNAALDDLTALDAALAGGAADTIVKAYAAMRSDAWQLLAGQLEVEAAYVARNGTPTEAGSFSDELDGRSRAHWFYRVASRSVSGLESTMSKPTPPICCPHVVPPAPPAVQRALADDGKVRLQWLRSPESDVARYLIYRAAEQADAADVRRMQEIARVAPNHASVVGPNEVLPVSVPGQPSWLEHVDAATPGEWIYRVVAEDTSGNRSEASDQLRGASLRPAPKPPVWNQPERRPAGNPKYLYLSWTHPDDQRLATLVERRAQGTDYWVATGEWLPRGAYETEDLQADPAQGWEYRLRVRDHAGQTADLLPVLSVPAGP
jgi:hypothetical protein